MSHTFCSTSSSTRTRTGKISCACCACCASSYTSQAGEPRVADGRVGSVSIIVRQARVRKAPVVIRKAPAVIRQAPTAIDSITSLHVRIAGRRGSAAAAS
eukprot:594328-Pleurochrysis_carterae.AAC.1